MKTAKIVNFFSYVLLIIMFSLYCYAFSIDKIEIKYHFEIPDIKVEKVQFIGIFEENPEQFQVIAKGEFKTGVFTLNCNLESIKKESVKMAKKLNCPYFYLINLKEPTILNTCYKTDIFFCIAKVP